MPTLYPENTNYSGISSTIKYPKITSAMSKSLEKQAQAAIKLQYAKLAALQKGTPKTTDVTSKLPYGIPDTSSLSDEEKATNISSYVNTGKTLAPASAFKSGMTVKEYEAQTKTPYAYETPTKSYQSGFLKPEEISPLTKIVNFEGGQFLSDPASPGKAIATARAEPDYKARELLLQGLNPNLYQIDHKIPLWAGGADTAANKEILTNSEHDIKTKMQSVPLTLLAHGAISSSEAMLMALNWKDKANYWDLNYPIPGEAGSAEGAGLIDFEQAKKIAQKWKEAPDVSWKPKDVLAGFGSILSDASNAVYNAGAKVANTLLPGTDPISTGIKQFGKGFTSGSLAGIALPQTEKVEDSVGTVGRVSHFVGMLAGNVVGFGMAYKAAVKGLAKAGVRWAEEELLGQTAKEIAKKTVAELTGKTTLTIAEDLALKDAQKTLGKTSIIRNLATKTGREEALNALKKPSNLGKIATIGGVSVALGQARPIPEDQTRMERAAYDFAYGAFMPVNAKYDVAGYARVAVPALTISLMEGLRPTDSYANAMAAALINAGTMVGFHGLGHAGTAYKVATGKAPGGILYAKNEQTAEPQSFLAGDKIVTVMPSGESKGVISGLKKGLASIKNKTPKTSVIDTTVPETPVSETPIPPSTADYKNIPVTALEKKGKAEALRLSNKLKEDLAMEAKTYLSSGAAKPEDFGIKSTSELNFPRVSSLSKLKKQDDILYNVLDWRERAYGLNPNDTKTNKLLVTAASREQHKSGLGIVARNKADLEDWVSYSKKMAELSPNDMSTPKTVKNLGVNLPEDYHTPPTETSVDYNVNSELLNGKIPFTGINIDEGKRMQFIEDIGNGKYAMTKQDDGTFLVKVTVHLDPNFRNKEAVQEGAIKYSYDPNKTLVVYVTKKDGTMVQIATVSSKSRIEDLTGNRNWSYNQNALDEWNKKHKTNLKLKDLTPEQRNEIGLFDPNLNFETLANEMMKKETPVISMTARITPETMNSKAKGSPKSFYMGYLNDDTWNTDTHNHMKALMNKVFEFTPAQAEQTVANIENVVNEAPKTEVAVTKVQKTPEELKAEGYKNFKDDLAKPNEYVEPVLDTAAGQVTVSAEPETEDYKKFMDALSKQPRFSKEKEIPPEVTPKNPSQVLRGTKNLTVDDIIKTYKNIKLKKDVPITNINGDKTKIKGKAPTIKTSKKMF